MTEDGAPATDGTGQSAPTSLDDVTDRARIPATRPARARSAVLREGVASSVERRRPRFAPLRPFPD